MQGPPVNITVLCFITSMWELRVGWYQFLLVPVPSFDTDEKCQCRCQWCHGAGTSLGTGTISWLRESILSFDNQYQGKMGQKPIGMVKNITSMYLADKAKCFSHIIVTPNVVFLSTSVLVLAPVVPRWYQGKCAGAGIGCWQWHRPRHRPRNRCRYQPTLSLHDRWMWTTRNVPLT